MTACQTLYLPYLLCSYLLSSFRMEWRGRSAVFLIASAGTQPRAGPPTAVTGAYRKLRTCYGTPKHVYRTLLRGAIDRHTCLPGLHTPSLHSACTPSTVPYTSLALVVTVVQHASNNLKLSAILRTLDLPPVIPPRAGITPACPRRITIKQYLAALRDYGGFQVGSPAGDWSQCFDRIRASRCKLLWTL